MLVFWTPKSKAIIFRNILGTKTLTELLADRENIASDLKSMIDTATDPWGIDVSLILPLWSSQVDHHHYLQIERVEVKDVRLPQNLQRAMAAEAEATREARAKVTLENFF